MKLDKKFYADHSIRKVKDHTRVPEDEWIVFLAKDDAFAAILSRYRAECARLGCDSDQLLAVDKMIANVDKWRADHPELCHPPHAKGEKMIRDDGGIPA
jgi:hypothetical protein